MRPALGKLLAIAAIAVVALAVVAGALSVADPFTQRRIRFDERRASDLAGLSELVGCYWRDRRQLPSDSSEIAARVAERPLRASPQGCEREMPVDPATDSPYGYRRLTDSRFKLCATFFEETPDGARLLFTTRGWETNRWKHPAGEHCFRFEVRAQGGPDIGPVIGPLPEA